MTPVASGRTQAQQQDDDNDHDNDCHESRIPGSQAPNGGMDDEAAVAAGLRLSLELSQHRNIKDLENGLRDDEPSGR